MVECCCRGRTETYKGNMGGVQAHLITTLICFVFFGRAIFFLTYTFLFSFVVSIKASAGSSVFLLLLLFGFFKAVANMSAIKIAK